MTRRLSFLPAAFLLLVCLVVLPACKKKSADTGSGGGGDPTPGPTPPAAVVNSEIVLFAHLNAKSIRESGAFTELKQAVAKAGGTAEWDKVEREASSEVGVKLTDVDAVTVCVTEVPPRAEPKFVLILTANKPIDKAAAFKLGNAKPDSRGFYKAGADGLVHFPDAKTLVMVHPDLAQKYLDGYAKNRSGWPLSAELTRAASGHTAYLTLNVTKIPSEMVGKSDAQEFAPLLAARAVTVTADLKGKQLSVAARASFADAAAAGRAKEKAQELLAEASRAVQGVMGGKEASELAAFLPAVKEADRALKTAKIEVSGSDLTAAGTYKADFDLERMVADAVKQFRETGPRVTAANNLRQIGLALHTYHDLNSRVVIHGTGPKGMPLKNATDKPLLSWRVAMLPFIEQDNLYKQFKLDEPWDSPANKKLIEMMPKTFASETKPGKPGYTHFQMVVGPNAMQPPATVLTAILDGTSNTIAVVEAAEPVVWTKPDDVMMPGKVPPKDLKKRFGGLHPGGFHALMWDGTVRFVRDSITERTLGLALDPRDGMALPSDW